MSSPLVARLRWIAFWLAIALLFSARAAVSGGVGPWLDALAWHVPVFLLWAPFAGATAELGRRFPIDGRRRGHLYLHVAAAVAFAISHLVLLVAVARLTARLAPGVRPFGDVASALALLFHQSYLAYWLVLFGSRALLFARRMRDQQVAAARLRAQLADARLAALRMQLHPHFLFNALNSIAELVHVDVDAAEQMVRRLASLLRTAIETATDHVIELGDEIDFLRRYLEVETMRFQDRLAVRFEIPPETRSLRVPALVLQPLVENAIRHGVGRLRYGGEIVVRATLDGDSLSLEVENDVGEPSATGERGRRGVGLRNTSERLTQLYGGDARLTTGVRPDSGRFLARLELPVVATPAAAESGSSPSAMRLAEARA